MEADWFVPLVREQHPGVSHDSARDAVRAAWAAVHGEAERAGVAPAEVDLGAVRRLLGMAGTPAEAAAAQDAAHPSEAEHTEVLATALRVVLAATKAYDDPPGPAHRHQAPDPDRYSGDHG